MHTDIERKQSDLGFFETLSKYRNEIILSLVFLKGLYLHLLAPIIGIFNFFKFRKLTFEIKIFLFFTVYGYAQSLYYQDLYSMARFTQLIAIFSFFEYFKNKKIDLEFVLKLVLTFSLVTLVYDLISGTDLYQTKIFNLKLPRYKGLIREYNYSALAYSGFYALSLRRRNFLFCLMFAVLIIFTGSRMGMVLVVFIPFLLIFKSQKFRKLLIISTLLYPLFIYGVNQLGVKEQRKINKLSSRRIAIQKEVLNLVYERPLGTGYFRGNKLLEKQKHKAELSFRAVEAHNLSLQVLFNFGVIGYLLLCYLTIRYMNYNKVSLELVAVSLSLIFLNGLHEMMLYLSILSSITDEKEL
ncbi:MAG: O-antigen ligase family protein [Bdellovibrionota bacterium]|nr:O-antigen ligase family protein [Bdellovibrionota bacterium]